MENQHAFIDSLFDAAQEFLIEEPDNPDLPFEFDEILPPYDLTLPLLCDWARTEQAAANQNRHPEFECLFRHALSHLRYGVRQEDEHAIALWETLQEILREALDTNNTLLCHNLIRGFAECDFVMPEALIERAAKWHFENVHPTNSSANLPDNLIEFPQNPDLVLNTLLGQLKPETASEIFDVLRPELHYLPKEAVILIAQNLLQSNDAMVCNAALMLLMHPRPAVRETLLNTLNATDCLQGIDARGRNRLITLRNFLSQQDSAKLDNVIKALNRRNLGNAQNQASTVQLWASVMDGAGATAIAGLRTIKNRCQVSGVILKEGVGIVDCWQTPLIKKSEAKAIVAHFRSNLPPILQINGDYLNWVIPHFLFLNRDSGELPSPALLEWLEQLGDGSWQPNRIDFEKRLHAIAPQVQDQDEHAAFTRLARWYNREQSSLRWFEISPAIDELVDDLLDANSEINEVALFEDIFTLFKSKWLHRMIMLSEWARCNSSNNKPQWQDFALLALAIDKGTAIADLPILPLVIQDSVQASVERHDPLDMGDDEDMDDEEFADWLMDDEDDDEADWEDMPYTPDLFARTPIAITPAKSQNAGRNDPCPCGSGKKFKKCCGN
jgi:hypothetical protein